MAQIDSRIALGFQPTAQIESPVNNLARILQVQGAQQANQLNQLKMDEYQSGVQRKNKLAALLGGQYETPEAREDALLRGGFMEESQAARKSRLDAARAGADTEKVKLQTAMDRVGFIGQLLGGVTDQATYDRARATAEANGLDVSTIPPQYDPRFVEQSRQQTMTTLQQLDQMWKQKGYDLDVRKQGETERRNRADESISRGQLGVAQGNLGLRRQELELNRSAPRGQFIQTDQGYVLADPRTGQVQPVLGPDGKPVQGKAATKNLTEGQAKANLFGSRMVEADRILSELGGDYSPMGIAFKAGVEKTPLLGGLAGMTANAAMSANTQKAEQAQRDFINAVLRRESGAVIADSEFDNARKQYFPQPGDSPAVIEQKARNRQTAIQGMAAEIPGGLRSVPTLSSPGGRQPSGFKILSVE